MKLLLKKSLVSSLALPVAFATVILSSCGNTESSEDTTEETPLATEAPAVTDNVDAFSKQVFSLNMLSNIGDAYNGSSSIQDSVTMAVNKVLNSSSVQQIIGNWQCVWGPYIRVGKREGETIAANCMFIAQKQNTDTFVVAIAGTDPSSFFEWFFEDLNIRYTNWDPSHPAKGKVSTATKTGFEILCGMGLKIKNSQTAKEFLADYAQKNGTVNVWVTGHSLGGALAPAYALYLHDNFSTWAPKANANIYCLAVAGATPGNDTFASYYNQQMGATTTRVWNTRDVVPHGYDTVMVKEVPTLYPKDSVKPSLEIDGAVAGLMNTLRKDYPNYTQLSPSTVISFTSGIYTQDSAKPKNPNKKPIPLNEFKGQILYQHIPAYGVFFNTLSYQQAVQNVLGLKGPFFTQSAYLVPVFNIGSQVE